MVCGLRNTGVASDWARQAGMHPAMQKASAAFAPQAMSAPSMLEPLPVSFPPQSGSAAFSQGHPQQPVSGALTSMPSASRPGPSEQAQQQRTSSPFVPQEMQVCAHAHCILSCRHHRGIEIQHSLVILPFVNRQA